MKSRQQQWEAEKTATNKQCVNQSSQLPEIFIHINVYIQYHGFWMKFNPIDFSNIFDWFAINVLCFMH